MKRTESFVLDKVKKMEHNNLSTTEYPSGSIFSNSRACEQYALIEMRRQLQGYGEEIFGFGDEDQDDQEEDGQGPVPMLLGRSFSFKRKDQRTGNEDAVIQLTQNVADEDEVLFQIASGHITIDIPEV
eukprot:m.13258 g.13258  ORF g.13258 m.13258 type:complete len:128 (+) comp4821_c0_seq1:875-1258(+)